MRTLMLLLMVSLTSFAPSAGDAKSALSASRVIWFGLDFTRTSFTGGFDQIGEAGIATGSDMRSKWIPRWNAMVVNEPGNFDLKASLHKDSVICDIHCVNELNTRIDPDECLNDKGPLSKTTIEEMVRNYHSTEKAEVGISFIVESYNKTSQTADVYVTFFNIAEKKVLISEKVSGKAMGIGMLNSWAGAIKGILKKIRISEYQSWKDKY